MRVLCQRNDLNGNVSLSYTQAITYSHASNCSFFAETATLDEIDLVFAISSAAAGSETTFQQMKDTVQEIIQTYKTDKLRYAFMVFGNRAISPINFAQTRPDEETVR